MRAFQVTKYKQPIRLTEVPEPSLGPNDVLVKVEAAGLNQFDEKIRTGEFKALVPDRPPFTLGNDVAGTVVAVGRNVTSYAVGDEIWSRPRVSRMGTFAERVAIDQADVSHRPTSISMEEAGGLPLVALTAWQALVEIGHLQAGQKVLIHAGTGGVGTVAIQLAKHLGATVATTVSGSNVEFARELGADVVVDYRTQRFEDLLKDYDLVVDGVGTESVLRSVSVVKPGGKVIGIAGPPTPAFASAVDLNAVLRLVFWVLSAKVRRAAKRRGVTYDFLYMHASGEQLAQLAELVDAGIIRPVVGASIPFTELPNALGRIGTDGTRGKTVMTMTS
ncbi:MULTISPECIES: NADP-dependent oxidoreductase [unclassified Nocardia]|uniref:NADP-dependent oxidoreductase n=1 Tax=unclassified Nocardia TaxID=2637762 RepID=UPI0036ACA404